MNQKKTFIVLAMTGLLFLTALPGYSATWQDIYAQQNAANIADCSGSKESGQMMA